MLSNPAEALVKDFISNSWTCIEAIVKAANHYEPKRGSIVLFYFKDGVMNEVSLDGGHFFLRSSVEYSNPQLTVEEAQGVVAARLLETCGNHFVSYGLREPDESDVKQICEMLANPSDGAIVPFLLNTDETEPDRYSMNPLKGSIIKSGQSAFPSASVKTEQLRIDESFVKKYEGSLICESEIELIERGLETCRSNYMNMVDSVKYEQLEVLSRFLNIDLRVCSLRMPLTTLARESVDGLLHHVISETHANYESVERAYSCMGRSMKKRTTLLTIPHSTKGYGSKRAARGRIYFDKSKLKSVRVTYKTTALYPNAIDPKDVSVAQAEDTLMVDGEKLANYDFRQTPSSPQFYLYSLASPENAALWHGIGAFGAQKLLRSYTSIRTTCERDNMIKNLKAYGISTCVPLQYNLVPQHMWFHPTHRNIDASLECVENLNDLVKLGMRMEYLSAYENIPEQIQSTESEE